MLTCKEVCAHHAGAGDQRMGWWRHLQRIFHLLICGNCRMAVSQIRLMLDTTRRRQDKAPTAEQIARWLQAIDRQQASGTEK